MADIDKINKLMFEEADYIPVSVRATRGTAERMRSMSVPIGFRSLWATYNPDTFEASILEQNDEVMSVRVCDTEVVYPRLFGKRVDVRHCVEFAGLSIARAAQSHLILKGLVPLVPSDRIVKFIAARPVVEQGLPVEDGIDNSTYHFDAEGNVIFPHTQLGPFANRAEASRLASEHREGFHNLVDALLVFSQRVSAGPSPSSQPI